MDLLKSLSQTLSGEVKVLITQCSIRNLYERKDEPGGKAAIELAKTFERRRCGHHPDDYPKPLSTLECLSAVVDPKETGVNKHRYVVACNDLQTRSALRMVKGTPLLYISRSVMIMEPMADESVQQRAADERAKLRAEIKRFSDGKKRKRINDENEDPVEGHDDAHTTEDQPGKKKKQRKGPKGPNPLSVKSKKSTSQLKSSEPRTRTHEQEAPDETAPRDGPKRKRRKKKPLVEDVDAEAVRNEVSKDREESE